MQQATENGLLPRLGDYRECEMTPMPSQWQTHLTSSRELFPIDFDPVTIGICASEGHIAGVFFNILNLHALGA
jgi:hypothetical protein